MTARRVVAIDTSGWRLGIALVESTDDGPRTVTSTEIDVDGSHAPGLVQRLEAALAAGGWSRDVPDAWVAVRGPGSFTGIRVALGTVHGLAVATGRPALGVDTLAAAAEAFGDATSPRVVVLPAGRGEVWGARFAAAGRPPAALGPASRWTLTELGTRVVPPAVVIGGAGLEGAVWGAAAPRLEPWPDGIAAAAGRVALAAAPSTLPAEPLYLRPCDAERGPRR